MPDQRRGRCGLTISNENSPDVLAVLSERCGHRPNPPGEIHVEISQPEVTELSRPARRLVPEAL